MCHTKINNYSGTLMDRFWERKNVVRLATWSLYQGNLNIVILKRAS